MGLDQWDTAKTTPRLYSEKYYSPPYSIYIPTEGGWGVIYCKAPGTEYIPNGRVEFAFNNNNDIWKYQMEFFFRGDTPPGEAKWWPDNGYRVVIHLAEAYVIVYKITNGQFGNLGRHDMYPDIFDQLSPTEWNLLAITWWSHPSAHLVVKIEVKINDTWHLLCDDYANLLDAYTDKQYNRIGIRIDHYAGYNSLLIDNIWIYKAV